MRTDQLPAIVKTAERLLLEVEKSVRSFPRYHKYQHGSVLRAQGMALAQAAHRAWRERTTHQLFAVEQLSAAIDDFKLSLQLARDLKVFSSGGQFAVVAGITDEVGKQCGGWIKHRKRQDAASQDQAIPQRPQILSSRPASIFEAHP